MNNRGSALVAVVVILGICLAMGVAAVLMFRVVPASSGPGTGMASPVTGYALRLVSTAVQPDQSLKVIIEASRRGSQRWDTVTLSDAKVIAATGNSRLWNATLVSAMPTGRIPDSFTMEFRIEPVGDFAGAALRVNMAMEYRGLMGSGGSSQTELVPLK